MDENDLCSESPPAPGIKGSFGSSCTQDKPFPLATLAPLGVEHPPGISSAQCKPTHSMAKAPNCSVGLLHTLQCCQDFNKETTFFFSLRLRRPKSCVFSHGQVSRLSSFPALSQRGFCCWLNFTLRQFLPEDLE